MIHLFQHGDYTWALFIGHISVEKALKARFVESISEIPPKTHDLVRIVEKLGWEVAQETLDLLDTVTTFNLRARYDDYKRNFARKCTKEYSHEMIKRIEEVREWILSRP
jgi:HEPN domain-containing protein